MKREFWTENKHYLWSLMTISCFLALIRGTFLLKTNEKVGFFILIGFTATIVVMIIQMYLQDRLREIVCVCGGICRYSGMDMDILMYSCEKCGYSISEYGKNYNWHSCPNYRPRSHR